MANTNDVKERLPGLQFRVESNARMSAGASGLQRGKITLICEFKEIKLYNAAIEKLNGFKMFSELAEEITDALGAELDSTDQQLKDALANNEGLVAKNHELEEEISRLRGLLQGIDDELDSRGEAVFNDIK
jgi:uncharacterized protein YicC (UPF0701 family)